MNHSVTDWGLLPQELGIKLSPETQENMSGLQQRLKENLDWPDWDEMNSISEPITAA